MQIHTSELRNRLEASLEHRIPRALTPAPRPAPELMPTGIAEVDTLIGGIPLGCLTEICGPESSGRTSVMLSVIAACMRRDEICALVDANDAFDPQSAPNAGVDLARLLWVRCGEKHSALGTRHSVPKHFRQSQKNNASTRFQNLKEHNFDSHKKGFWAECRVPNTECRFVEQALKATDLLLQAGGFGVIVIDLADVPISAARRIPLTTWFRFRRAVENTSAALVVIEQYPHAKSCASLVMDFTAKETAWSETADPEVGIAPHFGGPSSTAGSALDAVLFRVTSEGIAIPFDKPATSSFETPQRWNMPHTRLLNTVHVRLQVTRSRMNRAEKFPACSERVIASTDVARGIPTSTQHLQVQ